MAERLGNRASNLKIASSIPGRAKMTLCPWARQGLPVAYCKSLWIRVSAKCNVILSWQMAVMYCSLHIQL